MGTGYIIRLLGFALLTIASLSSCSLDQRSIAGGMARIQLNTRSQTGGPAKLGSMTGNGMTAPTASSYYVVDVEGEGIPRDVIEPTKCVRASPLSSAMVPALLQAGEADRTEIELLVPVGANRKIRIVRVDLSILAGTATPQFGESPFRFKMRNPSYTVSADMFILAEAEIPFLNGDQSVTLVEKAAPFAIPSQCNQFSGGNQPPIANADVELLNYEPWEGWIGNQQPRPYALWKDMSSPHYFIFRGQIKNKTNQNLTPPGFSAIAIPSHNLSSFGSPNPMGGTIPSGVLGPQGVQFYQWVVPMYSPNPSSAPYSVQVSFPYQVGASPVSSITQSFSAVVLDTAPPIVNPTATPVAGYSNLFRFPISFTRSGSIHPVRPYGSLVSMATTSVDLEPFQSRGVVESLPIVLPTPQWGWGALAFQSDGTRLFGSTGTYIRRYDFNGAGVWQYHSEVNAPSLAPTALLSVATTGGTRLVFVDSEKYIRFYDPTVAAPTISSLYYGGVSAQFRSLTLDPVGNLIVADAGQGKIFRLSAAAIQGALTGGATPAPSSATLVTSITSPVSVAADTTGNLYVAEMSTKKVKRISPSGEVMTLTDPGGGYQSLEKVVWGGNGLYVSDSINKKIYRVLANGVTEVFAGGGNLADGLAEDHQFSGPVALAVDLSGIVFVGDASNLKLITPGCPVSEGGMMSPRSMVAGRGCEVLFRVFSGGSNLSAFPPIFKAKLGDNAGLEAYHSFSLNGGAIYPNASFSGQASGLVFDSILTTPLTVNSTDITAMNGTWVVPALSPSPPPLSIDRVWMRSDAGTSTTVNDVSITTTSISIPRVVLGAPIREFEAVIKSRNPNNNEITFLKQRLQFVPSVFTDLSGVASISAGKEDKTCAVLNSGSVMCWGSNSSGHLGDGTTMTRLNPVTLSAHSGVSSVSAGATISCAKMSTGTVQCWGANGVSIWNLSSLNGVQIIGTGASHACAVLTDDSIKCWGSNTYGQLGDGSTTTRTMPVAVSSLSGVSSIASGFYHTCALINDGTVRCWGRNSQGQLGDGTQIDSATPVNVGSISGVVALSAGYEHTCALLSNGNVKCWGSNSLGQLGDGTQLNRSTPVSTNSLTGVTAISAGSLLHTCALLSDSTIKCWGSNVYGQLGDGSITTRLLPVSVTSISGVVGISAGHQHSCALLSNGTVKCWGKNSSGQLGNGQTINSSVPVGVVTTSPATAPIYNAM